MRGRGLGVLGGILTLTGSVLLVIGNITRHTGVQYEHERLYKKCLVEKQEMAYNKAIEYCEERVK